MKIMYGMLLIVIVVIGFALYQGTSTRNMIEEFVEQCVAANGTTIVDKKYGKRTPYCISNEALIVIGDTNGDS